MAAPIAFADPRRFGESVEAAQLSDSAFAFLSEFVHRHCGIVLGEHKRQLVQGRLRRRLRVLGLDSFDAYANRLRNDPGSEVEELTSAISTNVTAFFRESHHYELLADSLLPQWLAARPARLRLWSAGCATGEEAYALAMLLAETLEKSGSKVDARILATDLSARALAVARTGSYPVDRLDGVSEARRQRWFVNDEQPHTLRVHPQLRERVAFQPLNLLHDWPMHGPFDAIFCRNVVIYFDKVTKMRLFERFASLLPVGGYLFLGHSESMHGLSDAFELVGRTVYRKHAP